jgi:two-component system, NtrC family, nitrogen regulation response regulator GlnG
MKATSMISTQAAESPRVLIVDDEESIVWGLKRGLERLGYTIDSAVSAEVGLLRARKHSYAVILLDVRLPGMDGITAMEQLRALQPDAPIIIMTAFGSLSVAVKAVEHGAFDYLTKPFELEEVTTALNRACLVPTRFASNEMSFDSGEALIGQSLAMQSVFKRIALVAPSDASVLITGESGTGKELAARAIHRHSKRRDKPFITVHLAALNPNLIESELFGHTRGAFTGANQERIGLLQLADGGTIFLDELGDVPLPVQAKLLRVLEYQEVTPVGGSQPIPIRVRILSATHRKLLESIEKNEFRHDLYFRLNVFEVHMPALRDRGEDIQLLANYFLQKQQSTSQLDCETVQELSKRPWTGNVRELRNAIEHASILARGGVIRPDHLPMLVELVAKNDPNSQMDHLIREWIRSKVASTKGEPANLYEECLGIIEPIILDEVLQQTDGNRMAAARWLGLARGTLRRWLARYRAEKDETGNDEP